MNSINKTENNLLVINKRHSLINIQNFEKNNFQELFSIALIKQQQIKENTDFMKEFFSLLNLNSITKLIENGQILNFLDSLIPFFINNTNLSNKEKKNSLNGCENILFIQALSLHKYDYAEYLNQFRLEKNLSVNDLFLTKCLKERDVNTLKKLIYFSDKIQDYNGKILKLIYNSDILDYSYFQEIIYKYGLNINEISKLTSQDHISCSFAHLLASTYSYENLLFFNSFMKDYGKRINLDITQHNEITKEQSTFFDLILNNNNIKFLDKLNNLKLILDYCSLSEFHLKKIIDTIFSENIIGEHYNHNIYSSLFENQTFKHSTIYREFVLNKIIQFDNSTVFCEIRNKFHDIINPTEILLENFFRFSSPIIYKETHPFIFWLKTNGLKSNYSLNTLYSLIKFYRHEINSIGIHNLQLNTSLLDILIQNGYIKNKEKKIYFNKIQFFLKKLFIAKNNQLANKTDPLPNNNTQNNNKPISTINSFLVTKKSIYPTFNEQLYSKILDTDINKYIDSIKMSSKQFEIIFEDKKTTKEYRYIKIILPKFLNTSIENYLNNFTKNENEAKKNLLIQLKLFNKKTFEILSKGFDPTIEYKNKNKNFKSIN